MQFLIEFKGEVIQLAVLLLILVAAADVQHIVVQKIKINFQETIQLYNNINSLK